jgi:hypothetical protein
MPLHRQDVRSAKRGIIRRLPGGAKAAIAIASLGYLGGRAHRANEERKARNLQSNLTTQLVELAARIDAKLDV